MFCRLGLYKSSVLEISSLFFLIVLKMYLSAQNAFYVLIASFIDVFQYSFSRNLSECSYPDRSKNFTLLSLYNSSHRWIKLCHFLYTIHFVLVFGHEINSLLHGFDKRFKRQCLFIKIFEMIQRLRHVSKFRSRNDLLTFVSSSCSVQTVAFFHKQKENQIQSQ